MVQKNNITHLHSITPEKLIQLILIGLECKLVEFKSELTPTKKETYLTRLETSKMLSISLTCLNDWSNKGILTRLKLGNLVYYKLSEIETKLNNSNTL